MLNRETQNLWKLTLSYASAYQRFQGGVLSLVTLLTIRYFLKRKQSIRLNIHIAMKHCTKEKLRQSDTFVRGHCYCVELVFRDVSGLFANRVPRLGISKKLVKCSQSMLLHTREWGIRNEVENLLAMQNVCSTAGSMLYCYICFRNGQSCFTFLGQTMGATQTELEPMSFW